jgi:predicted PurR-regulated permease PerM
LMESRLPDKPPRPPLDASVWSVRLLQACVMGLFVYLGYLLFRPIMPALIWGGLLAVISAQNYERLVSRLKGRRGFGVFIIGLLYILVLVAPLLFFILEAIAHAPFLAGLPDRLSSGEILDKIANAERVTTAETGVPEWLESFRDHLDERIAQILPHLGGVATWLAARVGDLGSFLFEFLLGCVTSLVLLYNRFVVRSVIARLLAKIGGEFAQGLMQRTFDTTRGAFRGVVAAAIAQTFLSATALIVADVPGVVLLSALTFLLALVQIGPLVTAAIAGGILLMKGAVVPAGLIVIWFLVVVTSVDNLIRPYFTSQANDIPAYLTFLGALGGLLAFGLIGVFIGPVLIAILFQLLVAWLDDKPLTKSDENHVRQ